jgi:transcription initiation factor IIF auxiliary subunit/NAD-dependent SIR2 family protein deacetylase
MSILGQKRRRSEEQLAMLGNTMTEMGENDPTTNAALRLLLRKMQPSQFRCTVGNTCQKIPAVEGRQQQQQFDWTVFLVDDDDRAASGRETPIASVTFDLHPTFQSPSVTVLEPPFEIKRRGWGTFPIRVTVLLKNGETFSVEHQLSFAQEPQPTSFEFTLGKLADSQARRMEEESSTMHGHLAQDHWKAPLMVTECDVEARPGYASMKAHEYQDDPDTLRDKVKLLASLLQRAKCTVLYTGAGISTSSGIGDYATKSKATVVKKKSKATKSGLTAEPTLAHRVLTALHAEGKVAAWVQQNHDGLPQKAGFPQTFLNEIHGAWFDPSNPVVPMTGSLRDDLCSSLYKHEQKTDLCIAIGTSLCGMNADRMVTTPAQKFIEQRGRLKSLRMHMGRTAPCLGAVIIGLQQTQHDSISSLRIFSKIDEVMALLAWEMKLLVLSETEVYSAPKTLEPVNDIFRGFCFRAELTYTVTQPCPHKICTIFPPPLPTFV